MAKKRTDNPFVYSTDPNFFQSGPDQEQTADTPSENMKPIVSLESKHRGGKTVTLVKGILLNDNDLEQTAKKIKMFCGTGGSAKDGEIIIQGDQREKVLQWLLKNGFRGAKKR
jgi:translation initiation factor 1